MSSETRILELCRKAVLANDQDAKCILAELKVALREHMERTRRTLSAYPFARLESVHSFLEMGD